MELDELESRLGPFARAKYGDPAAIVREVHKMPGHAGFAYGFTAESHGARESWFLRIPPPNVQWRGTADVLRQVCALSALDGTDVPHCTVKWSGADLEWFGCPYFVVPKLSGDVLRLGPGDWGNKLAPDMSALAVLSLEHGVGGVAAFSFVGVGEFAVHIRCFAPAFGVPEDPVTGSANAALPAYLAHHGMLERVPREYLATQGTELGRDGRVRVRVLDDRGRSEIGGQAVTVIEGEIRVG